MLPSMKEDSAWQFLDENFEERRTSLGKYRLLRRIAGGGTA